MEVPPESFNAFEVALTEVTGEESLLRGGLVLLPIIRPQAVGLIVLAGLLLVQVGWLHVGVGIIAHPPREGSMFIIKYTIHDVCLPAYLISTTPGISTNFSPGLA